MKILVNSCIIKIDRMTQMRRNIKPCAARPREGVRHALGKLRRVFSMKIAVEKR